jgi:hypothetical protein
MKEENVVFIKSGKIDPLVNGGDGSHSHVLERSQGSIRLVPSISEGKVVTGLYLLIVVLASGATYSLLDGEIFDGVLLLVFAWGAYIFIKTGKGACTIQLKFRSRRLTKRNKKSCLRIDFDDIGHVEIINKVKSAGNGYHVKTSELNVSLRSGKRVNLATGGDMAIIIGQATALAEAIGCDVHHDDKD